MTSDPYARRSRWRRRSSTPSEPPRSTTVRWRRRSAELLFWHDPDRAGPDQRLSLWGEDRRARMELAAIAVDRPADRDVGPPGFDPGGKHRGQAPQHAHGRRVGQHDRGQAARAIER